MVSVPRNVLKVDSKKVLDVKICFCFHELFAVFPEALGTVLGNSFSLAWGGHIRTGCYGTARAPEVRLRSYK